MEEGKGFVATQYVPQWRGRGQARFTITAINHDFLVIGSIGVDCAILRQIRVNGEAGGQASYLGSIFVAQRKCIEHLDHLQHFAGKRHLKKRPSANSAKPDRFVVQIGADGAKACLS